ncbi:MAG TPA: HU family DNA-binding protein [Gemmataceae bacterium]|nr:HU family DNA-binding protein [Gemmataceae bacterium]
MAKKTTAKPKSMTKSAIMQQLADHAGVSRKQAAAVFDGLRDLIKQSLKKDGDTFTIPGLIKLRLRRTKAVKGGKPVLNRFTGQMTVSKDKPAMNRVRARALKGLQDLVQ